MYNVHRTRFWGSDRNSNKGYGHFVGLYLIYAEHLIDKYGTNNTSSDTLSLNVNTKLNDNSDTMSKKSTQISAQIASDDSESDDSPPNMTLINNDYKHFVNLSDAWKLDLDHTTVCFLATYQYSHLVSKLFWFVVDHMITVDSELLSYDLQQTSASADSGLRPKCPTTSIDHKGFDICEWYEDKVTNVEGRLNMRMELKPSTSDEIDLNQTGFHLQAVNIHGLNLRSTASSTSDNSKVVDHEVSGKSLNYLKWGVKTEERRKHIFRAMVKKVGQTSLKLHELGRFERKITETKIETEISNESDLKSNALFYDYGARGESEVMKIFGVQNIRGRMPSTEVIEEKTNKVIATHHSVAKTVVKKAIGCFEDYEKY